MILTQRPQNYLTTRASTLHMTSGKITLTLLLALFLMNEPVEAKIKTQYQQDLEQLQNTANSIRRRIRRVSNSKAYDYLKLLPSFSIAQRSQSNMLPGSETFISVSINTNQIFDIADRAKTRAKLKRLSFRKISALQFKIHKLINRKWLIRNQMYKYYQIKGSLSNPVKVVQVDEKILKLKINLDNVLIEIKNTYTEIESVCIEIENS
jgi:hypothetical protein